MGWGRDSGMHAHLADVIDEHCIADAHHERHPLQAVPRLGGVLQPLHTEGAWSVRNLDAPPHSLGMLSLGAE